MSTTRNFRRQHDALAEMGSQLTAAMARIDSVDNAQECARLLAKITGVLTIHLAAEDRSLYPRMIASNDQRIADTAREFSEAMGGLADTYRNYEANWRSSQAILADPQGFRTQTREILAALAKRIERENTELYPLAEGMFSAWNSAAA